MSITSGGSCTIGEVLILNFYTFDSAGVAANATSVTCTITLPNNTTTSPSVTNTATGVYQATYSPAVVGHFGVYWAATGTNATAKEDAFNVEDNSVSPPISLTDVKNHLNITVTDDDAELLAMLNAATGLIEGVVGPLSRRTVTAETHNGGRTTVLLKQAPIISITSCLENGSALAATSYSVDEESGVLTRTSGYTVYTWGGDVDFANFNNISVTYVAGRSIIPADLAHAVLELVRHLWTTQRGSIRRSGTDDYVPGSGFSMPNRVREMLNRYQQVN